ncbi:MAG: AIR synthase-related protein, partial [Roseibacillus sp.]
IDQIQSGRISAAHDLSEGGLLVTVAEMLFGGDGFGVNLNLPSLGLGGRFDALLFGESQGRVVVAVQSADADALLSAAKDAEVEALDIGVVNSIGRFQASVTGNTVIDAETVELQGIWENAIPNAMDHA